MFRLAFTVIVAALLAPTATVAQDVSDYSLGPQVPLPDTLREQSADFSIIVTRSWADDVERGLLEEAERLLPDPSIIEAAVDRTLAYYDGVARSNWSDRFEEARRLEGPRWWWLDGERARIPFALTGGAVQHLVSAMRTLSGSDPPDPYPGDEPRHSGSFRYEAEVVATDDGGHVVELSAEWTYHCGSLCGFGFTITRRVTFDAEGTLLAVEGDGPPPWWVS